MQGRSLANLDNLELMAIKVPFIWCRARVRGVQPNGNHDKWHPLSEGHFSSLDWFVISTFGIFFLNPGINSQWQILIFSNFLWLRWAWTKINVWSTSGVHFYFYQISIYFLIILTHFITFITLCYTRWPRVRFSSLNNNRNARRKWSTQVRQLLA